MNEPTELNDSDSSSVRASNNGSNNAPNNTSQLFQTVGSIAAGLKNSIFYVLIGGAGAAFFLAWQWIDFSTTYLWIILKATPLLLPLALWGLLYMVVAELADLPNRAKIAKKDGGAVVQRLKGNKSEVKNTSGFFGKLKNLFRVLRSAGNLAAIIDAVGGVVLIANPIFALLIFISGLVLVLLMLTAMLVLIF